MNLAFLDAGNPEGVPVAFLHGFMSSNHQWELNRPRLGDQLRTILVEQPGHGQSPPPVDADAYRPPAVLNALDEIRSGLGLEQWWLVGHSLGGAIALRYALDRPEATSGAVFTNSRAVFGIDRPPAPDGAAVRMSAVAEAGELRKLPFHPIHAKRFPEALKRRMVDTADAMAAPTFAALEASGSSWRSRDELHRLSVPVLLVNGRWEKAFQPWVEVARSTIPDVRVVELEGGHSINIEQPEAFDEAVLDFITDR